MRTSFSTIPLLLLLSCGTAAPSNPNAVCPDAQSQVGVVTELTFARITDGASNGFDLDGVTTGAGMPEGCGVEDYTHPDGTPGIDNALGAIVPLLELTEAAAAESLVQQAINQGDLLFLFELNGVDDLSSDDCVDFSMYRGSGLPMLGTDGKILSGQTFDVDPTVESTHAGGVELRDRGFTATDLTINVPLEFFDAKLDAVLEDAQMRMDWNDDGTFTGYMAGTFDYWAIIEMAENANVDRTLVESMPSLFGNVADLEPDAAGNCTRISVTFEFNGTTAFIYDAPAEEASGLTDEG